MRAWWGRLSLRARLAGAFGILATGALVFLFAAQARALGPARLGESRLLAAMVFALAGLILGGWLVSGWCLDEIARLGARIAEKDTRPLPAELEGLAALLRREAQKHDRLMMELRRFTADASHELRTPLTALRTVGEVALRPASDPAALRDAIGDMLEEAQRMNSLIAQLLRLARLESDELPLHLGTVDLQAHLAAASDSVVVLAEEKGVHLALVCAPELEVTADPELLSQAVINLLHNAIRHTRENSDVTLAATRRQRTIVIEVSDQGPGVPREHQDRIFERFYRVEPSRGRTEGGAGLGLCIARTAIERLGGQISVESEPGQGATFRIELPAV